VLLFLAVFYFVIATNTQSGWLFLLSAFLLGLLAMCWLPPRRAAGQACLHRELLGSPQRGVPLLVRLTVSNQGRRALREVLAVEPPQGWAEESQGFRWIISRLAPGAAVSTQYALTPSRRGEHRLAGGELRFGAPFGLFSVARPQLESEPFLVYPRLLTLSAHRQRTRLAGLLTEFTSPRSKGDSRSLRSLREYQAGDDLRLVHWKSSAKTGGATLLVREHHAPSRQLSLLLVDSSGRPGDPASEEAFEKAVMLAASLLWSAHRAGTKSTLLVRHEASWQKLTRWEEQYTCLARLGMDPELSFAAWLAEAGRALQEHPESRLAARPFVVTSASSPAQLGDWSAPGLAVLVVTRPDTAPSFASLPVTTVDVEDGQVRGALDHV
jgi:uncharacterized protein (DUF58 family)